MASGNLRVNNETVKDVRNDEERFEGVITHWDKSKNHGHVKFHDGHRMNTLFVHMNKIPMECNGSLAVGQTITFRVVRGIVEGKFQADEVILTNELVNPGPNDIVKNLQTRMRERTIRHIGVSQISTGVRIMTRPHGMPPANHSATNDSHPPPPSAQHPPTPYFSPQQYWNHGGASPQSNHPIMYHAESGAEYYPRIEHLPQEQEFQDPAMYAPSFGSHPLRAASMPFETLVHEVEFMKHRICALSDELAAMRGFVTPSIPRSHGDGPRCASNVGGMQHSIKRPDPGAAGLPIATRIESLRSRLVNGTE